uniref:Uncharacterized protein n=1 Tax=Asterionellopsis glacialis TaxID=33640 RepID=A0A7S0KYI6_9STRA
MRDLRRAYDPEDLGLAEGLDADYLSVAVYALSRSFLGPHQLKVSNNNGNDPYIDRNKLRAVHPDVFPINEEAGNTISIPDIPTINKEILYSQDPDTIVPNGFDGPSSTAGEEKKDDPFSWYEYEDNHESNSHRFYPLNGLASGPTLRGPLTLGEITAAGIAGLGAKSRLDAEKEMVRSDLFQQFVGAVRSKGFFRDPATESPSDDPEEEELRQQRAAETYEDRYRKVVGKFRTKLANKAQQQGGLPHDGSGDSFTGNFAALSAAEKQRERRLTRIEAARAKHAKMKKENQGRGKNSSPYKEESKKVDAVSPLMKKLMPETSPQKRTPEARSPQNEIDVEEAEKHKGIGNKWMQKKDYGKAVECYTMALKLCPDGPTSHVYFSNRAAALLSMKKFEEAIRDSERSVALKPDYGKAHSRLGLGHFLLGNYRQAVEAYNVSLKYEPENKSSQNYLEKARKKLISKGDKDTDQNVDTSFSVVSEYENAEMRGHTVYDGQDERQTIMNQKEAEKFKHKGNAHMASREYQLATEAYTEAINFCPDGHSSHVYFSNRAAALCYLERYAEAEKDSERSLALKPEYGKAHARLGLSRFFMGDHEGAVTAYTNALKFDPDNAASKSYLAKAKARLDKMNQSK